MARRIPVVATLVVVLSIAVMVGLGLWQLQRKAEKEALLVRYAAAIQNGAVVPFPRSAGERETALYHHSVVHCLEVKQTAAVSGRNDRGEAGWARTVRCRTAEGADATVVLGWARDPATSSWPGGTVTGIIAPGAGHGVRLVAVPPQAGLAANAMPDPREIPNNHLSYAVQWFLFALSAGVIYAIALWKRLAGGRAPR